MSAKEAVLELPTLCDRGTKKNAKGYKKSWNGYKLHLDINDTGFPVSALVISASLHDSQVAIPLIKQSSSKFNCLYDLMDAAYDAKRYKTRSIVEWANGRLKENFGASNVMVKEYCKVTQHLIFGVIVLFVDQLMRLL